MSSPPSPQDQFIGNDKHLKVLRQASEAKDASLWHQFINSMGPRFRADLRGADLEGFWLVGFRLIGARLDGANLIKADLTEADLTRASLGGAKLQDAVLTRTKLSPTKVKVIANREQTPLDETQRRRLRLEKLEKSAQALLKDREQKEEALKAQQARVRAKNSPVPFQAERRDQD